MQRPSWPQRMLMLAELWSQFSTCVRRRVGAVIYDPKTYAILGVGYNDTPFGAVDCGDGGCPACGEGSVRDSTKCECVAEGQRVLTDDFRWIPIEDIEIGQRLWAFDEISHRDRGQPTFRTAFGVVTNKVGSVREATEYVLADNTSLALTPDHRVLTYPFPGGTQRVWRQVAEATNLCRALQPWGEDPSRTAGWLAGFFDGEGCLSYSNGGGSNASLWISAAQAVGPTLERVQQALEVKGFGRSMMRLSPGTGAHPKTAVRVSVKGGWPEQARFLGQIRPERLVERWLERADMFLGGRLITKRVPIVERRFLGRQRVYDLTTTTRSFVVEGFAVHNCVHAEMNAILLSRADVRGAHLAVWNVKDGEVMVEPPCVSCHKNRIQAGIEKVLIGDGDHFEYVEP